MKRWLCHYRIELFVSAAAIASALLLAQGAGAQCTSLVYVGAPQSYFVKADGPGYLYNSAVIGTITLAAPLAPNLSNQSVTPAAWDFSALLAGFTSTSSVGANVGGTFAFTTDANGNITGWNFSAVSNPDPTNTIARLTSQNPGQVVTSYGGQYTDGTYYDNEGHVAPAGVFDDTASTAAGVWYCPAAQVASLQAQLDSQVTETQQLEIYYKAQIAGYQAAMASLRATIARLEK